MKKTKTDKITDIIIILVLLILCATFLYPYINQLAISLNEGSDSARGGIYLIPRKFTFDNYKALLSDSSYILAFIVSVSRALINVVMQGIIVFAAAYALTRRNLKGRKLITKYLAVPSYLHAGLIPTYILYRYLGLINSFWVYVLPYSFAFYNMIIVRSFVQDLPKSLEESALLDGANEMKILFKIVLPLSLPVLATVSLWTLVGQWNDWTTTLYYVTNQKLFPLQYLMMRVIKQGEQLSQQLMMEGANTDAVSSTTTESLKSSMIIATSIPIVMVYPFLQKYFVKGVTLGAVKE